MVHAGGPESAPPSGRIDLATLRGRLQADAWHLRSAAPFPHVALDTFLRPSAFTEQAQAFPGEPTGWSAVEIFGEQGEPLSHRKLAHGATGALPPPLELLVAELQGGPFMAYLEDLTGICGLRGDPTHHGGLLHQYLRGARLGVHLDANVQPATGLDRRINVIFYVHPTWEADWGGELELYSPCGTACEQRLQPWPNRCVIFLNGPDAYHGLAPVQCPEDRQRRTIFLRYYTAGRPEAERRPPHRVRWLT
ncbi:MAG TPA: 2OG-Fe(II) oxygenase [Myxococcota bacterium]|nr:2OG-Fe(II) oxygenase [Myxococcota bacterium]